MIKALFPQGADQITVNGLHQWDYGQQLQIEATDLSAMIEVHFACIGMKDAIVRPSAVISGKATVAIPDVCLEQSAPITAWIFEIKGSAGTTTKTIILPVISRARPAISEEVPEDIGDKYTEAVAEINALVGSLAEGDVIAGRALKADEAATAADAKKINGLAIARDSTDVLKIGDRAIPQRLTRYTIQHVLTPTPKTIYNSSTSLAGRTFEFIDCLGTVYKLRIDPTNKLANQTPWEAGIREPNYNVRAVFRVEPESPNLMTAFCEDEEGFTIEKIYEIVE